MVAPHGGVRVMFPVTLEVARYSWSLLGAHEGHFAILKVVQVHGGCFFLGLLLRRPLTWACSHGGSYHGPGPMDVADSGLLQ